MSVIVLSAGGTGGHLFPAQALAGELAKRRHGIVVMTDARFSNYATAFPDARIVTVPSAPLSSLGAPFKIAAGIWVSFFKLLRLRPAAVVGFGGYPSVPVMLGAVLARLPTAIVGPDAVLGRANRLLAGHVNLIAAGFPLVRFLPRDMTKVRYVGNPLRPEVTALWGAPYETPRPDGPLRLLIFGGSQGARALSRLVPAAITRLPEALKRRLDIVQQCRPEDLDGVRAVYAEAGIRAELAPFFTDLPARMAAAHLVIGRSGAGTVSELMAIGRPAILIPLPHALDDNQTPNADILANAGAGWRVHEADLTPDNLAAMLAEILSDPEDLARRAAKAHALAAPGATGKLADLVENLARRAA